MAVITNSLFFFSPECMCFDISRVEQIPTELKFAAPCAKEFVLKQDIKISAHSGFNRTLEKNTRWDCVGKISQGIVYKTKDQILTIEASNIYEANIVVSDQKIVGFYLPVEKSFSPISSPVPLIVNETITQ